MGIVAGQQPDQQLVEVVAGQQLVAGRPWREKNLDPA